MLEKPNITERMGRFVNNPWVIFVYGTLSIAPTIWFIARPVFRVFKMPGYSIVDRVLSGLVVFVAFAAFGVGVKWLFSRRAPKPAVTSLSQRAIVFRKLTDSVLWPCISHRSNYSFGQVLDRIGKGKPWYSDLLTRLKGVEHGYRLFREALDRSEDALEVYESWDRLTKQMHDLLNTMTETEGEWRVSRAQSGIVELTSSYIAFVNGSPAFNTNFTMPEARKM